MHAISHILGQCEFRFAEHTMRKAILLMVMEVVFASESRAVTNGDENDTDLKGTHSDRVLYQYIDPAVPYLNPTEDTHQHYRGYKTYTPTNFPLVPETSHVSLHKQNPLAAALVLSSMLHLPSRYAPANHPELPPVNPFIALLLSQYGRYLPHHGSGRGLYGYQAANNLHNNKPFGSYKIYQDSE